MDPPSPDSIQPLSKRDAQQAFIKYASEKCCYSTKPAEEGVITLMETFDTYRYCLETFTETRTMERSQKPYFGEKIDTEQRTPPGKWEIPVNAPDFFHEGRHEVEVPHTSSVKACIPCCATGRISCMSCGGAGGTVCCGCGGSGLTFNSLDWNLCVFCNGCRMTICGVCNGAAEVRCFVCLGRGRIRVFTVLIVSWHNNRDQHTVEQFSGLKMSKLDKVPGRMMFTDTGDMVHPVRNFSDPAVVQTSESFLRKHQKNLQSSKTCILKQRQTIELLPISKVTYEWREESHVFVVYGRNFKVSAEDYPAACCSCCSLM
ncbi:protein SSUH2 homolog isoform X1 [Lates calcarifer]|uniref:Protein SSUH2 homolog isoform X1 n=1 Tax=Lates calcarifer TaxID=8187 RepID=A0AAJ7LWS6_LATCA|nr:protein SSUH2 homolog isoform X1 [Lates calcarifer]